MDLISVASVTGLCIVSAACAWAVLSPPPRALRMPLFTLLAAVLAGQASALASTLPPHTPFGRAWALCGCAWWSVAGVPWLWLVATLMPREARSRLPSPGLTLAIGALAIAPWIFGLFGRAAVIA